MAVLGRPLAGEDGRDGGAAVAELHFDAGAVRQHIAQEVVAFRLLPAESVYEDEYADRAAHGGRRAVEGGGERGDVAGRDEHGLPAAGFRQAADGECDHLSSLAQGLRRDKAVRFLPETRHDDGLGARHPRSRIVLEAVPGDAPFDA